MAADRLDPLAYHELTKHSAHSVSTNRHFLDWETQPSPFKLYSDLEPLPLPRNFSRQAPTAGSRFDRLALARLLHFTGGITRKRTLADGSEYYFRAAACTGALYHIDLYIVCGALDDLAAGVYHFGPHDFSLRALRRGDHRQVVVDASGEHPAVDGAPVILVCTSTFWRNAWKYQARTYRHCFWDNGTMLANLLAVAEDRGLPAEVVVGFADPPVNELLGLDTDREVALSLVALGRHTAASAVAPAGLEALMQWGLEGSAPPPPHGEVDYPAIRAAHAATSLATGQDARLWREQSFKRALPEPAGEIVPLSGATTAPTARIEEVIARRGSARRFIPAPITFDELSYILRTALTDVPCDFAATEGEGESLLNDVYLIVNAVDGLPPGAYVYLRDREALELLKTGDFRRDAGHLDLGQELAADAAVNFYLLSDLVLDVGRLGERGYRAASLEAAIIGGKIYLAAYGLGLGATGLTFFDDDVTEFFSPHAAGKGVMFLTAVGRTHQKESKGKARARVD